MFLGVVKIRYSHYSLVIIKSSSKGVRPYQCFSEIGVLIIFLAKIFSRVHHLFDTMVEAHLCTRQSAINADQWLIWLI